MPTQPEPKPTSSSRRAALRDQRAAQETGESRRRLFVRIGVVAAAVVALVAGIAVGSNLLNRPAESGDAVRIGAAAPAHATIDGAVRIGKADAPVTVSIFTDFICPYCKSFESVNAEMLSGLLTQGRIKVEVYPLTFLDEASLGTRYSTRAANAFATVADADPDQAWNLYQLLYAQQPAENTTGLTDAQLAQLGEQAGASAESVAAFGKLKFRSWTDEVTRTWFPKKVSGTPTIKINGTVFTGDPYTAGPLAEEINKALTAK